ncbi:MAG TPA: integrase arm-type DNA-binding domain-containing protein [Alcaligenes faecalis]|nr:integrase arm-type DNA-binding domain-containing protein [Alcaligenes faecalis]
MAVHLLTRRRIESAPAQDKPYTLRDGGSLFLTVTPAGGRLWHYRYRIGSAARVFAIGPYPQVSLATARQERDRARELVRQGIHPLTERKARVSRQIDNNQYTFKFCSLLWLRANSGWSASYAAQVRRYLEQDAWPRLGDLPITDIQVPHLRPLLLEVAERGPSAAMALRQWISQVFVYAAQQGLCEQDPASMLKRLIKRPAVRHHPPLLWSDIRRFQHALQSWPGNALTKYALRLLALTFVRTIELRRATWDQFDLDNALWTIPPSNMKMRRPHMVPLSRQVLAILQELHVLTGTGPYLFPNRRDPERSMGSTTLNHALEALGYKNRFSAHGFRSTATTLLGLLSYPENRIDLQLAHIKKDPSRAPYDHAKYLSSRRVIMQDWADILDLLTQGDNLQTLTQQFGPLSTRRSALLQLVEREH